MRPDVELIVLFAGLHLIGLALAALLLVMFVRSDTVRTWSPPEDEGGAGGGNDRVVPRPRSGPDGGGLPLPDAEPARVRLRGPGRLADARRQPDRRPAHAPEREPARPDVPARAPS
jgi:hypothetical protein